MISDTSKMKFCKHCGSQIVEDAVICIHCGRQVEALKYRETRHCYPPNDPYLKNKWVALCLWLFLGLIGGHKFYEGKPGMGVLYLFTAGLFGIGWLVDLFSLLFKPTYYYA
ncbi:MAG: NINE protein [Turicibacter sp.]|nr:NINE protein [Turicibacter sp.]